MDSTSAKPSQTLFAPVRTKRAFEEVCNEIKRLIFRGVLKPGDKLPSEIDLATQFSVSRQTVREALRLLEITGFISMQKGGTGGPLIVDTILNTIGNSYLDAFQMKKITIDELTTARVEIEKMILKAVFRDSQDIDVQCLEENVAQAKSLVERKTDAFRENIHFHLLLAMASKNYVFVIVMESILTVVADIRSRLGFDLDVSVEAVRDHEKIVEAIKGKDHQGALSILERHLVENGKLLREFLKRYEGEEESSSSRVGVFPLRVV